MNIPTYIKNPSLLDERTLPQIKTLLQEYPYFQTLHLLLLKNLKNLELSSDFNESLRKSALYVGDRKKLFILLKKNIHEATIEKKVAEKESSNKQSKAIIKQKSKDELIQIDELQQIESYLDYSEQKPDSILDTFTGTNLLIIEDYFEEKDLSVSWTGESVMPPCEKSKQVTKSKTPLKKENIINKDIPIIYPTEYPIKENEFPEKEKSNKIQLTNIDLIDSFIKSSPRIVPDKSKMEENIDISINGTIDNGNFITERLAEIYIEQKLYSKAIYTYEKLCLKYPKKNTYFAAKIEEVKKK